MRMKLNKSSQLVLVSAAGLLAAMLVTACAQITETKTIDFVYVASSKAAGTDNYGEINIFEINSDSGKMRQIPASPVPSGGRYPISEAVAADYSSLFVANHDDNSIVQFVIGTDGKLYAFNTVNTPGVFPVSISASSSNLFVADTYQPLPSCSPASPCSGSIAVFPLTAATSSAPTAIGKAATNTSISAQYWPLTLASAPSDVIVPTAVSVLPSGKYVYVAAYDSTVTPHVGYVFAFAVGSGGVLTAVSGSPFTAGVQPSGLASDTTGTYLYATDFSANKVLGFAVNAGVLASLSGSPYPAGTNPSAIAVDQAYNYAFVANSTDSTVTVYSSNSGVLTRLGSYAVGLQPVAIGVDPSTERFVFTANFLGNNVSGYQLQKADGTMLISQGSPFSSNNQPTAVAAIPHNGTGGGIQ
jgi:3-carboxy-cis,cis-muconate lactonizing enzyme.